VTAADPPLRREHDERDAAALYHAQSMTAEVMIELRPRDELSLERDDFSSNHHLALTHTWRMIFSENRYPLFGIMR